MRVGIGWRVYFAEFHNEYNKNRGKVIPGIVLAFNEAGGLRAIGESAKKRKNFLVHFTDITKTEQLTAEELLTHDIEYVRFAGIEPFYTEAQSLERDI